jgi:tetratricopeptide (TPR) repeat protein
MGHPPPSRARWLALALFVATLVAYGPAYRAGFVWDDDFYVTANPYLGDLAGLARIWVPGNTPQYYPTVFTSFWLQEKLHGLEPFGYHLANVLLHAGTALLAWRVLHELGLRGAGFVALLFALHPVHVESVAWISERKNVLSGVLYLAAALAWLRFQRHHDPPDGSRGRWHAGWYAALLALFLAALLAKSVTCSLPAALVLVLLLQGRKPTLRRLAPLVPLFVLGFALALHTAHYERTRVIVDSAADFELSFAARTTIATRALLFYLQKLLVPWPLAFVYPRWRPEPDALVSWIPAAVLLGFLAASLLAWSRGRRGAFVALAFFAGTLFPALGYFDVYPLRYSFVADHFQYLASLGPLALAGAGLARLPARTRAVAALSLALALGTLTWLQSRSYHDPETLWRTTLARNPEAWMARGNLAKLLSERGEHGAALHELELGLAEVTSAGARSDLELNRALVLGRMGQHERSLAALEELQVRDGGMELRLAAVLERLGRAEEARVRREEALAGPLRLEALVPAALFELGRGDPTRAVLLLEEHLAARPTDTDARLFLADAQAASGDLAAAIRSAEHAREALRAAGDARTLALVERRLTQFRAAKP